MTTSSSLKLESLIANLNRLWTDEQDKIRLANTIHELDVRYNLGRKIANEPGAENIIQQMFGRLSEAFGKLSNIAGRKILDIACGSNTSKAPESLFIDTPFGKKTIARTSSGYTVQFEPWFCRILFELNADVIGIDFGDLDHELFTHYQIDLGQIGALDFLEDHAFDAVQDSRLFGSPEFTAQFPDKADRLKIAWEIKHQEQRLLKGNGLIIHSDIDALLR